MRQSSELTTADYVEILSHYEERPTGHRVQSWDGFTLVVEGEGDFNPADHLWLKGVNSLNPFTFADTGQSQPFLVSSAASSDGHHHAIAPVPPFRVDGPYRNCTRLPEPGDEVWTLMRKAGE